ncbi:MAG: phosphoribosylamine--glycine ligase, partial [bacterium]
GDFAEFDDSAKAAEYIEKEGKYPIVVKADGLAAGKGVIICANKAEALGAVDEIMDKKAFGGAGDRIVIEEFLEGEETSILAFTDGGSILALPASQDHKRIYDNDEGPNTGGMGAYAPAPLVTPEMMDEIMMNILEPTLSGLKREGIVYRGILYAGIIVTKDGPKVLEYNVRFGDPETQAVLPLLKSDIVELFLACADGTLHDKKIEVCEGAAICVVQAAPGYPGEYKKGAEITGIDAFNGRDDLLVFQAGTKKENEKTVTSGGRVLALTALGGDIDSAAKKVYENIDKVNFEGAHYRKDIGARALKK